MKPDFARHFMRRVRGVRTCALVATGLWSVFAASGQAQTANGEIEGRAATVARRKCIAGSNAGALCNGNADCPGSSCVDRNIFNISVAVHYDAPDVDLDAIEDMIRIASDTLFDVTDGQAEIGRATIHNNAFGTTEADVRVYSSSNDTWWATDTGFYRNGGSSHVSINRIYSASAPGESLAHELVHLIFDARDEYETGCGGSGTASCPSPGTQAAGEISCLMESAGLGVEGEFSELCWGQADPANEADISGGNHDAPNNTEQSRCRSNRSCWEQVVWSWPNTFTLPAGAPDPDANGAVADATTFLRVDETARVVMVLDESGSMSLESPSRMDRLKVGAKDFIALAESGTELGIVSFATDAEPASGRVNLSVSALGSNRTPWNNAITGLAPSTSTNIGDGLARARQLIMGAGGVTSNTFVVLMTDGLNNTPTPQSAADSHLHDQVTQLLSDGVPVYVTCTGSDFGLDSQCAEIASGTAGTYVDSANASRLPPAFIDLHAAIAGHQAIASVEGKLSDVNAKTFFVEEGSNSVIFALSWQSAKTGASMIVVDPAGQTFQSSAMPSGAFVRVPKPRVGLWKVVARGDVDTTSPLLLRAYSRNADQTVRATVRRSTVKPGEPMEVYAFPRSFGGAISDTRVSLVAEVTLPDGSKDKFVLHDRGRASKGVDDVDGDGVFSGVYTKTKLSGAYTFMVHADLDKWPTARDVLKRDPNFASPRIVREVRVASTVRNPDEIEKDPDDNHGRTNK